MVNNQRQAKPKVRQTSSASEFVLSNLQLTTASTTEDKACDVPAEEGRRKP